MTSSKVNRKIKIEAIEAVSDLLDKLKPKLKSQPRPEGSIPFWQKQTERKFLIRERSSRIK